MTDSFAPRLLSFSHDREQVKIAAEDALADARLAGRPLIVLGEAGSGKSELLRRWSGGNVATARQLANGWQPGLGRNFVDGLDEAAGLMDGDALDRVLGVLGAQRNADFVLACRIADWQSASAKETIKSWTGFEPVELTIEPFGRAEIVAFLHSRAGFDATAAEAFVEHYAQRNLTELRIPTKPPPRSEKIAPPYSEMMSPPRERGLSGIDRFGFVLGRRQAVGFVFRRRILSPSRFSRWALWTRRSRMASA